MDDGRSTIPNILTLPLSGVVKRPSVIDNRVLITPSKGPETSAGKLSIIRGVLVQICFHFLTALRPLFITCFREIPPMQLAGKVAPMHRPGQLFTIGLPVILADAGIQSQRQRGDG